MSIKPLLLAAAVLAALVVNLILAPIALSAVMRRNLGPIERIELVRAMAVSVLTHCRS